MAQQLGWLRCNLRIAWCGLVLDEGQMIGVDFWDDEGRRGPCGRPRSWR